MDASSTGYAGYIVEFGNEVAHGQWLKDEAILSSTWRELKAVFLILCSFAEMAGNTVKWFTDNQGVKQTFLSGQRGVIFRMVQWPFLKFVLNTALS